MVPDRRGTFTLGQNKVEGGDRRMKKPKTKVKKEEKEEEKGGFA